MRHFVLSLGTNMGDRMLHLRRSKIRIEEGIGVLTGQSSIYETAAWGNREQAAFYNQVVEGFTTLAAEEMMTHILQIECEMGRKRQKKWSPRIIDIDIIFLDDEVITKADLIIPHPMFHMRRFTLAPLMELMPDFIDPRSNKKIREIWDELDDNLEVRKLE